MTAKEEMIAHARAIRRHARLYLEALTKFEVEDDSTAEAEFTYQRWLLSHIDAYSSDLTDRGES